jgi:hypothetical protein
LGINAKTVLFQRDNPGLDIKVLGKLIPANMCIRSKDNIGGTVAFTLPDALLFPDPFVSQQAQLDRL